MPFSWWTDTITVLRPAQVSSRGTTVPDWAHATSSYVYNCSVQDMRTSMTLDGRQQTDVDAQVFAPVGSDIQAGDRVTHGGRTYAVVGEPAIKSSPLGGASHLHVLLSCWRG